MIDLRRTSAPHGQVAILSRNQLGQGWSALVEIVAPHVDEHPVCSSTILYRVFEGVSSSHQSSRSFEAGAGFHGHQTVKHVVWQTRCQIIHGLNRAGVSLPGLVGARRWVKRDPQVPGRTFPSAPEIKGGLSFE